MKLLKSIGCLLLVLLLGVVVFYVWGSSSRLSSAQLAGITTYVDAESSSKDTLIVLSYNIGYLSGMTNNLPMDRSTQLFDENLDGLKNLMDQQAPDIIGFQEIDFGSNRSHFRNQLDSIAISGTYHQAYRSINWDKNYVPFPYWPIRLHFGEMLSGQAIVSRFPLEKEQTIVLEKPINAPFYYNAFYLDRLLQIVQVKINDRILTVMNVHLEAFDKETREAQAFVVKDIYESFVSNGPVILLGDFNSQPPWEADADEVMKTLLSTINIASAITKEEYQLNPDRFHTFDTERPYQMIDFILYSPEDIQVIEANVLQEAGQISDHLPVMMKFIFRDQNDTIISE